MNKREKDAAKNEETAFFINNKLFSLLSMPEMVRLNCSVKETWEGITESYVHPVKDQITIIEKTDTYMPTLLTEFLQSQYIISLNENNSLHKDEVYKRSPSYKIYDRLD